MHQEIYFEYAFDYLRDSLGRILPGARLSPGTEIKPGQRFSIQTEFRPGERRSIATEFGNVPAHNKLAVGAITIRKRKNGTRRRYIKVAEPNKWEYYARHVWEKVNGPIPVGYLIHHKDRDTLNDSIENLELANRSEHVNEHRDELLAARGIKRRSRGGHEKF